VATVIPKGTIKRLHVDQHAIRANRKGGLQKPPLTAQTSKGPHKGWEVEVRGPSKLVYSPGRPLSCGATVWVETHAEVELRD
jgi:hypothetical protein